MAADPSVYRGVEPVQIQTPQQWQIEKNSQDLTQADQQQKLQAARETGIARSVLARLGNDPNAALGELRRVAPTYAVGYEKQLNESRKSALESLKLQNDVQKFRTERGLDFLQMAKATNNPAAYAAAVHNLAMDDEDAKAFPQQMPDPQTLDQMLEMGLSIKDRYELHDKAIKHYTDGDLQRGFATSLLSAGNDPESWKEAQQAGITMGVPKAFVQSFGDQPTPEMVQRAQDLSLTPQQKETAQHNRALEAQAQATQQRLDAQAQATQTREAASLQERMRHNRVMETKPTGAAGAMPQSDTDAIADAIVKGEQPPVLTGLYGKGAAVRAALAKRGYNLADAQTDWTATQKHLATLNGAQQTRMRQAVDNAYHSLDVIEDLAKQWDGGKFPLLNKAQLALAKQGVLGPKAQQLATQLEAQISDVTSELGNVYMGGNSPTDHALSLASKNLSADWTKDQLISALGLARKNLAIRTNSMNNVSVAGVPNSQYLPATPAQAQPAASPAAGGVPSYQDYLNRKKGGK